MLDAYIFNVGQASFNMIFDKTGKHLLIVDCGYQLRRLRFYKEVTTKEEIIQSFKQIFYSLKHNIDKISIVLSHTDLDHISGLREVLKEIGSKTPNAQTELYISRAIPDGKKVALWGQSDGVTTLALLYYYSPYRRFQEPDLLATLKKEKEAASEVKPQKRVKKDDFDFSRIKIQLVDDMKMPGTTFIPLSEKYRCVIYNPIAALRWHYRYYFEKSTLLTNIENITDEQILEYAEKVKFFEKEYNTDDMKFAKILKFADTQSVNPFSLICKIVGRDKKDPSILLPGDTTSTSFKIMEDVLRLANDIPTLDSDIYIGSHHGAAIAPKVISDIIKPKMIIYSAPLASEHGHIKTQTINDNIDYFNSLKFVGDIKIISHKLYLGESGDSKIKEFNKKNIMVEEGNEERKSNEEYNFFMKREEKSFSFKRKDLKPQILNNDTLQAESKAFINEHLKNYVQNTLNSPEGFHNIGNQKEGGKVQSIYIKSSDKKTLSDEIEWKEDQGSYVLKEKDEYNTNIGDILKNNTAKKHTKIIKFMTNLPIFSTGSQGTIKLSLEDSTISIVFLKLTKKSTISLSSFPYNMSFVDQFNDTLDELTDYEQVG